MRQRRRRWAVPSAILLALGGIVIGGLVAGAQTSPPSISDESSPVTMALTDNEKAASAEAVNSFTSAVAACMESKGQPFLGPGAPGYDAMSPEAQASYTEALQGTDEQPGCIESSMRSETEAAGRAAKAVEANTADRASIEALPGYQAALEDWSDCLYAETGVTAADPDRVQDWIDAREAQATRIADAWASTTTTDPETSQPQVPTDAERAQFEAPFMTASSEILAVRKASEDCQASSGLIEFREALASATAARLEPSDPAAADQLDGGE